VANFIVLSIVMLKPVMAVPVMGLVPMSPVTEVTPLAVRPDLVKMANCLDVPRSTGPSAEAEARRTKRGQHGKALLELVRVGEGLCFLESL
jgi:hypothetical protein